MKFIVYRLTVFQKEWDEGTIQGYFSHEIEAESFVRDALHFDSGDAIRYVIVQAAPLMEFKKKTEIQITSRDLK